MLLCDDYVINVQNNIVTTLMDLKGLYEKSMYIHKSIIRIIMKDAHSCCDEEKEDREFPYRGYLRQVSQTL